MSETEYIRLLYQLAETSSQEEFQQQALESMQEVIQFDASGWGEHANTPSNLIALRAHLYELPPEFHEDINEVQYLNPIVPQALQFPSRTINVHIEDASLNADERFKAVVHKYDAVYNLFTVVKQKENLFIYTIGLLRKSSNKKFNETERQITERLIPHLIEAFRLCRRFNMQKQLIKQWETNRGVATCDQHGLLHDADDSFVELVKVDWPDWQGAQLPDDLTTGLNHNLPYKSKQAFYRWTLLGDLYFLVGTKLNKLQQLSDREFQIASLYSNGQTHNEIADQLSIAPATARNHLANIYEKLELDSKDKLVKLFA